MTLKTRLIETFYTVATGSRKIRNFFTPIGALFFALLIFSFVVIALQVDRLLGIAAIFPRPLSIIFALPIFAVALFLIGWSVLNFIKAKGTPVPFNPPPQLVATGPYAYVRNPMLSGVFFLLFGFGVLLESVSLLEPELEKRLGADYIEYRKRTPMFFPGFGSIFKGRK
jgi:protein-S-isoprenylcysteine O-methyltransferase Ste14